MADRPVGAAKVLVVDVRSLSSAVPTSPCYGLERNPERGVLIRGGMCPLCSLIICSRHKVPGRLTTNVASLSMPLGLYSSTPRAVPEPTATPPISAGSVATSRVSLNALSIATFARLRWSNASTVRTAWSGPRG